MSVPLTGTEPLQSKTLEFESQTITKTRRVALLPT